MTSTNIREQILTWAGGFVDLDEAQMGRMVAAWQRITDLYPDDLEDQDERDAALSAALQVILGETTLEEEGAAAVTAEGAVMRARAARNGAIIASQGADSEARLAERAQTTRKTVRRAVGK